MIREILEFIAIGLILIYFACVWVWRNICSVLMSIIMIFMIVSIWIVQAGIYQDIIFNSPISSLNELFFLIVVFILSIISSSIAWQFISMLEWEGCV